MFRHISKITASKFKFSSSTNNHTNEDASSRDIESWLREVQIGFDALLDDQLIIAEDIFTCKQKKFSCSHAKSPFHAFGYAFLVYTKAMLALERTRIDEAIQCVSKVQAYLKQKLNRQKTRNSMIKMPSYRNNSLSGSCSVPLDMTDLDTHEFKKHIELLHTNCMLMSATLQFLLNSWTDTMKAAYDLYKSFKFYEQLFECILQLKLSDPEVISSPDRTPVKKPSRRSLSCHHSDLTNCKQLYQDTLEHGAYFGIGLFNMIFSLLPFKVGKVLNNLGFHSSRLTAIRLLKKSQKSDTMYGSLSSLVLLSFYANISIYIQPQINQFFLFQDAKSILKAMRWKYPNGKIWQLIEGKFELLEGHQNSSIAFLNKAKKPTRNSSHEDDDSVLRNASITEFAQFRSFAIYEIGWAYMYSGDYFQAIEVFFCLESMCNWSRIFYHYISTCCMIAEGLHDKAVLEVKQIINMFEQKRKSSSRMSSNEHYAELKVQSWLDASNSQAISLKETLQQIINPVWELVYLWNGARYWQCNIVDEIKHRSQSCKDPVLCLIVGVVYRDKDKNIELAMEYLNLALLKDSWAMPYAMYEIAATHCALLKSNQDSHPEEVKIIVSDWIQCIERYYVQN
ncbi:uncharacterized protein B0P05DRAFT_500188, partial [Gilbertella persicaria]|uniref:uncharacterized protein n=1 Tax=Gilbertella persicaria TaxID=101096 RepID=UPI002220B20A